MDPIYSLCLQGSIIVIIYNYIILLALFAKGNSIILANNLKKYLN